MNTSRLVLPGIAALLLALAAALYSQTDPAIAPATAASVPAPILSATLANGKITFIYKGVTISAGDAGKVTAVQQVSATRVDLTFSDSGLLPRFIFPVVPNINRVAPIYAATPYGPAIAAYIGKDFIFAAASSDDEVIVYQKHDAPSEEHPEFRSIGITSDRKEKRELTLALCVDEKEIAAFNDAYVAAHPMKVNWPDRRPIVHLACDDAQARNLTLRNWALQGIQLCKSINGQLALYQGLEGMDDASGFKYMGCPELIDEIRSDKLAGLVELHKKAGIAFGFCVRPWAFLKKDGKWGVDNSVSPQDALYRHMDFVSKLGATAVYIDSCDTTTTKWLADLHEKYPNILLIPEQPNAGIRNSAQLAYGAPLRECDAGHFDPLPQLYPDAFQVLLHAEGLTEKQWEFIVSSNGKFIPFVQPTEVTTLQRLRKIARAAAATKPAEVPATAP